MNNVIVEFVQKIDGIVVQQFDPILVSFQVGKNGSDANVTPENVSNAIEEFTSVTPTLESEVILGGGQKTTIEEMLALGVPNPEIYIGSTQPENTFKLWIDTSVDDVDILRAIRDANPQSTQLAALFDDTKDPHTEWNSVDMDNPGAFFTDNRCTFLNLNNFDLEYVDLTGLDQLTQLNLTENSITSIIFPISSVLFNIRLNNNLLESIDISELSNVTYLYCKYNNLPQTEIDRLISLGFDANNILPQNTPA